MAKNSSNIGTLKNLADKESNGKKVVPKANTAPKVVKKSTNKKTGK